MSFLYFPLVFTLLAADPSSGGKQQATHQPEAKSAEASRGCIRTRHGFVVELVAAEPLVQSPIAFAWGPDGKFWVVEMGDYPLGLDGKGKPGGRIKFLEDTNGDGKYDKATVFLDGLSFPTGVLPWRKGVLVTCAPEIFYAEDTDGDGKADRRVPLYTGFALSNPQLRVNGLTWGVDNWIYGASGRRGGGRIKSVKTGQVVDIGGRDFRFRPDSGALESVTGQSQYGRCQDDWGNWFGGYNSEPLWHYVLADQYLRRNPHVAPPNLFVPVSQIPGAAPVYPVSRTLPRFNAPHEANHFTSACSPIVYRDELFGPAFINNTFVSEPVHNLVHREIMAPQGVTFRSRRADDEQHAEFLASRDNWFRPTMLRTGPDGALWVADMYRLVIEHAEWIPKPWPKALDFYAGQDKGRIYRVYPAGIPPRAIPRLDRLDTAGLVAALDSPSGWQRDLVQQMLLWRNDKKAVPLLEHMVSDSRRPQARLQALCTLDGLQALRPTVLRKALADAHPGVRRQAVRLCETRFADSPELGEAVVQQVEEADPPMRLQLACTLGACDDPQAAQALGRLALLACGEPQPADPYLLTAVKSSISSKNFAAVLHTILAKHTDQAPPTGLIPDLLCLADAMGQTQAMATLLAAVSQAERGTYQPWQFAALARLLDGLDQRDSSLARLERGGGAELTNAVQQLASLFAAARTLAVDPQAPRAVRRQAVRLLGRGLDRQAKDLAVLERLLAPRTPDDLQTAAIAALGGLRQPQVPQLLLDRWKSYAPARRAQVLDVLLVRGDWVRAFLGAMEREQVLPVEVDAIRQQRLLEHKDHDLRERAARLFASTRNTDRQKVIDAYSTVRTLHGEPTRGQSFFTKSCAVCHRLNGLGNEVGPSLAALGAKSTDYLLVAILDPNQAVEAPYVAYTAEMKNGQILSGVLARETSTSITLVGPDGKTQEVLRANVEALTSTGKSAMPEGLEKELPPQALADLIAYLRAGRRPKVLAGNKPELVRPLGDGSLRLEPGNGEIHGPSLVLETKHGSLSHWSSPDDHAVWTVEAARPGKYRVWLDYACAEDSAGNTFVLETGDSRLIGKVVGTPGWEVYRQVQVGVIHLQRGRQQIVLRSSSRLAGKLLDLKSIWLVP